MWAAEMKVCMFCDVTEIIYLISIMINLSSASQLPVCGSLTD